MRLLESWRQEAVAAGRRSARVVVAYEAGRDGFWLARWLRARGIEAHVIHATSVTVTVAAPRPTGSTLPFSCVFFLVGFEEK